MCSTLVKKLNVFFSVPQKILENIFLKVHLSSNRKDHFDKNKKNFILELWRSSNIRQIETDGHFAIRPKPRSNSSNLIIFVGKYCNCFHQLYEVLSSELLICFIRFCVFYDSVHFSQILAISIVNLWLICVFLFIKYNRNNCAEIKRV